MTDVIMSHDDKSAGFDVNFDTGHIGEHTNIL
jgi:hypothetical protein